MRTVKTPTLALAAALVALGAPLAGCSWTTFDDLADQAWAQSTEKPDVDSTDYGVAIVRGSRTQSRLVVLGTAEATYSELVYDAAGKSSMPPTDLELNSQFGIGNLDAQPIAIADPNGDEFAMVINGGTGQLAVIVGKNGDMPRRYDVFIGNSSADAGTFMQAPGRPANQPEPLVASNDVVLGTFYANTPNPQPACRLLDAGAPIMPRALGTFRKGDMTDDVIAWGAGGKLYRYPGSVFSGCGAGLNAAADGTTGFSPGRGSRIIAIDGSRILLEGHHDGDDQSFLQVYDAGGLTAIGPMVTTGKQRSAAVLDVDGAKYAVVGHPTESVDGVTAGVVRVYRIGAMGLDTTPVATFHDAEPEDTQLFGRSVSALPFAGKQVITVAAKNEIFVYFRVKLADGTSLYEETRQGR